MSKSHLVNSIWTAISNEISGLTTIDLIVSLLLIVGFIVVVCSVFKYLKERNPETLKTIRIIVIVVVILIVGAAVGNYVVDTYVIDSGDNKQKQPATSANSDKIKSISSAMDYTTPAVRNAALSMVDKEHGGKMNVGQICDIFDYLKKNWVYVNDPVGHEYNAPASTSIKLMRGDCDDFAILMASCMEAIGASSRVVCAKSSDGSGHAYAEVYIGKDKAKCDSLIKSISRRYNGASIHYTTSKDSDGNKKYWLNLDWQEKHAGGKYYKSVGECLIIYPNGYSEKVVRDF